MRWVVVVGLSAGVMGCVGLNPDFGGASDGADSTGDGSTEARPEPEPTGVIETTAGDSTGGLTSGTEPGFTSSSASSTGSVDPPSAEYLCDADQFDILITPAPQACVTTVDGATRPVTIEGDCMSIRAEGPWLLASPATGCDVGTCLSSIDGDEMILSAQYINLGEALDIGDSTVCRYIWAYGFPINGNADGECSWDALAIWSTDGELELAVGNGLPDDGFPNPLAPRDGSEIKVDSTILDEPTTCGVPEGECPRQGWRAFSFGDMDQPALPDGIPVNASLGGQALSVVNIGLQFDLSCHRFGRWGVVPRGKEEILER